MDVQAFVRTLRAKGVELQLDGEQLRYKARSGVLSKDDIETLKLHKQAVLELLRSQQPQESVVTYYPLLTDRQIRRFPNCTLVLRATGQTDPTLVARALRIIEARHSVLKARFVPDSAGRLQMMIDQEVETEVLVHDHDDDAARPESDSSTQQPNWAADLIEQTKSRRFDLERGPLAHVALIKERASEGRGALLVLVVHHSISDAWSMALFLNELRIAYRALRKGVEPDLPPLRVQFADYVREFRAWTSSEEAERQLEERGEELRGIADPFYLPADQPSDAPLDEERAAPSGSLPLAIVDQLAQLAKKQKTTLFTLCLTAFNLAMSEWSGRQNVMASVTHFGREHPDHMKLFGCFVELWLLNVCLNAPRTFVDALHHVTAARQRAMKFHRLPYWKLKERLAAQAQVTPLLDVTVNFPPSVLDGTSSTASDESWRLDVEGWSGDTTLNPMEGMQSESGMKLFFWFVEHKDNLGWHVRYNRHLFRRSTVETFCARVGELLVAAASDPAQPLQLLQSGSKSKSNT